MNEDCELVSLQDGDRWQHRCEACRLSVRSKKATLACALVSTDTSPVPEVAPQPPKKAIPIEPSLPRRLANFTQAAASHLLAGLPQASQTEIDRRFAICQTCQHFNGRHCTHTSCGCTVSSELKFLNKLAWADQRCPVGKW